MLYAQAFFLGLLFSFVGSVPPGTLNLCVLQLGLEKKISAALRFAFAVSLIEYPYAWIGVEFETWLTSTPAIVDNFQLLTAAVMLTMGAFNIWAARKPTTFSQKFNASGFRRGLILSILNPMAIPFWLGVTAYLRAQGWVNLSSKGLVHIYVLGTSIGAMLLLTIFTFLAARLSGYIRNNRIVALVPGVTLVVLGVYALIVFLFRV